MKEDIPYNLIASYLAGECTEEEKKQLETWIDADRNNAEVFNQIKCTWIESETENYKPDVEAALHKVNLSIQSTEKRISFYPAQWIRIAAAVLIIFGITGIVIVKNYNPQVEILTSLGQKPYQVELSDGSVIILNAASRLVYPKNFKGSKREIEFEGEAYFKISPDKSKPFIIYSENSITKVLGTEFNLKTKKEEKSVQLTVTEGLVSFSDKKTEIKVTAGEAAEIEIDQGKLVKSIITDKNFLSWKTGKLIFENQSFGSAINAISEYYNKEIVVTDTLLSGEIFSASFDSLSFEETLENIKLIMDVQVIEADRRITLKSKD